MSQKRKATNDEGVYPSKKAKTDIKVVQTLNPRKSEVVENKVEANHKTSPASKIKQKKNRKPSGKATLQKNNKTGQTKDGLSSKTTGKATVTGEETLSSKNKLSVHLPRKPEEVSCNWKQLLKVCQCLFFIAIIG